MKNKILIIILFLISIFNCVSPAQNRNNKSLKFGWITLGAGRFSGKNFQGVGGIADFSYVIDSNIFTLRYISGSDATMSPLLSGNFIDQSNQLSDINDISVLYGLNFKNRWIFASISAGAGYFWGKEKFLPNSQNKSSFAFPAELQIFFTPLNVLGIGIKYVADVNKVSSFNGILFCLQLGKVN